VEFLPSLEQFWESLPSSPGVYFFEDENKDPLYIGKSINLKTRLKQHFEGFKTNSSKAAIFIPQTKYLYLKILDNDIQAIIVEANYIKSFKPKYNSITKDDKSNLYIIFSNEPEIRLLLARATDIVSLNLDNYEKQVYGPYTSASIAKILLRHIRKTFGYCLHPFNPSKKACFNYHLGQCSGACTGEITFKEYLTKINIIKKFLSGKFVMLQKSLKIQINKESKKQNFENASFFKKQYESLQNILSAGKSSLLLKLSDSTQKAQGEIVKTLSHPILTNTPRRIECYDLAHLQGRDYVGAMSVMENGELANTQYRKFHISTQSTSDPYAMKEIVERRLKHLEWSYPDLIILDGGKPQLNIVLPIIPKNIAVIALAKKKETIMFYDKNSKLTEINLGFEDPVLNQFITLRDEAHRFGNSFHKKQRGKSMLI
jgi:excinuclease ABC subunit C